MGTSHLCVPEHVALQLKLEPLYQREVTIADGEKRLCPYVGPVELHFDGRACFTGALVLGDEVLLDAVPMEDMDLVVNLARQEVTVNPDSPNIPSSTAKPSWLQASLQIRGSMLMRASSAWRVGMATRRRI